MKIWPLMLFGLMVCAAHIHAQNESLIPADDRKEPKTLSKLVQTTQPAVRPAADALDDETPYRPETNYRFPLSLPSATPAAALLKSAAVDKTLDGARVRGYQTAPEKKQPLGAILLLPEWRGLGAEIKSEADWWAQQGFRVLVFDLYEGQLPHNRNEAARLSGQLNAEKLLPQLKAALTLAGAAQGGATTQTLKTCVMGFGIGAKFAQELAAADERPAALVLFYGELLKDPQQVGKIKALTLGIFADEDGWVTPDKIDAFKKAMTGAKLPPLTYSYRAQPGFMFNTGNPADKSNANLARQKVLDFLTRQMMAR